MKNNNGSEPTDVHDKVFPILAYPFRIFFLLAGLWGMAAIPLWLAYWLAGWSYPGAGLPMRWHVHEMLFGLAGAAIAGFLLTAVANWTGRPALRGLPLAALALAWLAARLSAPMAGLWPDALILVAGLAFPVALTAFAGREVLAARNWRNLGVVAVLLLWTTADMFFYLDAMGWVTAGPLVETAALDIILLLMAVIAGRITPTFTVNWLSRQQEDPQVVRRRPWLDRLALLSILLLLPADLAGTGIAPLALTAALLNGWRLSGWAGWVCRGEPLLWVLHLGYAWIVAGLLLKGLTPLIEVPAAAWQHAVGVGAMGTLIIGVMTRVALGHTGRPLRLPRGAVFSYGLIGAAALVRLVALSQAPGYDVWLWLSALCWSGAFALFVGCYWRILSSPRPDGRPG